MNRQRHSVSTPSTHLRAYRRGFTLLEVVAVVAVIGIIALVAWMSFGRTNDSANDQLAKQNVSQYQKAAWSAATVSGDDAYTLATLTDVVGTSAAGGGIEPCTTDPATAQVTCKETANKISMGTSADGKVLALAKRSKSGSCVFLVATGGKVNHIKAVKDVPAGQCTANNAVPVEGGVNPPPPTGAPVAPGVSIGAPPQGGYVPGGNNTPRGSGGGAAPTWVSTPTDPGGNPLSGAGLVGGMEVLRDGRVVMAVNSKATKTGTARGDIMVVSADTAGHFNVSALDASKWNSKVVAALAVHPQSGEVYFATQEKELWGAGGDTTLWKADKNFSESSITRVSADPVASGCSTGDITTGAGKVKAFATMAFDDAGFLWAVDNPCGKLIRFDHATESITDMWDLPSVGGDPFNFVGGLERELAVGMVATGGKVDVVWMDWGGVDASRPFQHAQFDPGSGKYVNLSHSGRGLNSIAKYTPTLDFYMNYINQTIDTRDRATGEVKPWAGANLYEGQDLLSPILSWPVSADGSVNDGATVGSARFRSPMWGVYDSSRSRLWVADSRFVPELWDSTGGCAVSSVFAFFGCIPTQNVTQLFGQDWTLRLLAPPSP